MTKQCKNCFKTFQIYQEDLEFYQKISVPQPTLCPDCRQQRRLAFRNERYLYNRRCDLCSKKIISTYQKDSPYKVYCSDCWWGDKWQALNYGRDFDFNLHFFPQFQSLMLTIPRLAIINKDSENSEYTNLSARNKNCYLVVESSDNENCLYCYWVQKSRDLIDCSFCHECELSYECDNCYNCYELKYSRNCQSCHSSNLIINCKGCSDCLGCVNLVNKKYCILNKQYSEEDYKKFINNFDLKKFSREFIDFSAKQPKKFAEINKCENCLGNYLEYSQNCFMVFHGQDAENCRYAVHVWRQTKDCLDVDTSGMNAELIYESINTAISVYNNKFCCRCWTNHDLEYCDNCDNSHDLFGCTGLHHQEYCILNKQYEKSEYFKLKEKIISYMLKTGEYGEFFPINLSPYAYNETAAYDYYPLSQQEVANKKWSWLKQVIIKKDSDSILPICIECNRNYNVISQEQKYYLHNKIPMPQKCPNCRHIDRMRQRNPNFLWHRQCQKPDCHNSFETTYSPDRKELVYCERCYNAEVY